MSIAAISDQGALSQSAGLLREVTGGMCAIAPRGRNLALPSVSTVSQMPIITGGQEYEYMDNLETIDGCRPGASGGPPR